jgi:copper(I)-binding protein
MRLEQGVMKMQAIPTLEVPAGQTVQLAPGAYHVMLMRLSKPVEAGAQIPMQLTFELANQKRQTVEVTATVRALNAQRGGDHGQHHNH